MSNHPKKIRTLNFDPGLTMTGWSVTELDLESGVLQVIRLGNIQPAAVASRADRREDVEKFSKRVISLVVLRAAIIQLLDEFKPDYIVMEDIFFNPSRPQAHAALCMWQCTAKLTVYDHYGKTITAIAPKAAKLAISGRGDSKKLNVQQAILENPKITFKSDKLIPMLNEHCADSVAIGYAFVQTYLPTLLAAAQTNDTIVVLKVA